MDREVDAWEGNAAFLACEYITPDDIPRYFYNMNSGHIECIEDIKETFGVEPDYFLTYAYDYDYLVIPVLDLAELQRAFIRSLHRKKYEERYLRLSDEALKKKFFDDIIVHNYVLEREWRYFLSAQADKAFAQWCREYQLIPVEHKYFNQ